MGKLHELLAVEPDLKSEAMRVVGQLNSLFAEGTVRLLGQVKSYDPLGEGEDEFPSEIQELATTVDESLKDLTRAYGKWIDAALQKECSNTVAVDVVEIGGKKYELPATALLMLEGKLAELRALYKLIPTNDPTVRWEKNEQQGFFVSSERVTYRTRKVPRSHVLYDATIEHPAQVEMYHEDIRVGKWTQVLQSGMLTPQDKKLRLQRIDKLLRDVRQARQRANSVEADNTELADVIFEYINEGADLS